MTEQLKLKIQESLSNKDYHTIYEVFVNNGLSFTDLLVFYKKNDVTILSDDKFWNSHLVHYYLAEILNSDIKINFLKSYFENESYNNDGLNEHLIIICKDDYIKHFKLWSAFKKPLFWASFRKISEKDTELAKIRRELEIVLHSQKRIQTEEKKDEQYFLHFTIGDLLLGFTLYYYEFKQQPHVLDNKSWQTMIEVTVLTVLDRIFLLHKCKSSMQFGFKNNSELQEYFAKNKAPHHIVDKKNSNNNINKKFNVIYSLIERAIAQTIFRNQIQLYLCGFAEFESINDNKGKLSTNNRYRLFQINNAKSTPEEYYFSNLRVETIPTKPPIKTDITSIVNTLNFYGFPTTITVNGFNIEIEKVIKLLKYFSVYKGNEEKGFINNYQTFIFNKGESH